MSHEFFLRLTEFRKTSRATKELPLCRRSFVYQGVVILDSEIARCRCNDEERSGHDEEKRVLITCSPVFNSEEH